MKSEDAIKDVYTCTVLHATARSLKETQHIMYLWTGNSVEVTGCHIHVARVQHVP